MYSKINFPISFFSDKHGVLPEVERLCGGMPPKTGINLAFMEHTVTVTHIQISKHNAIEHWETFLPPSLNFKSPVKQQMSPSEIKKTYSKTL